MSANGAMTTRLLTCMMMALSLSAASGLDKEKDLIKDVSTTKSVLEKTETDQRKIMSALFGLNHRMKKIVVERSTLDEQRMAAEVATKELAKDLVAKEQELKSEKSVLLKRMNLIYRFGEQGAIRFLFSAQSSAQLEKNLRILGLITARDLSLVKNYEDLVIELKSKRTQFQSKLAKLNELSDSVHKKEMLIAKEEEEKSRILATLKSAHTKTMAKLSKLRKKSAKFLADEADAEIVELLRPAFFEQKGQLSWPADGRLGEKFGVVKDPQFPVTMSNKGVFISSSQGSGVRAIFSGKVAFLGALPGFGETAIIDHGDHYYSVYSHLLDMEVDTGDEVKKDQIIASVGSDIESRSGIYFEVRHFSEPTDPRIWMKGPL